MIRLAKPRLPLFQGILPLDRSQVLADIMAGVTLAAVGIPEVMGYTKIINMPFIVLNRLVSFSNSLLNVRRMAFSEPIREELHYWIFLFSVALSSR